MLGYPFIELRPLRTVNLPHYISRYTDSPFCHHNVYACFRPSRALSKRPIAVLSGPFYFKLLLDSEHQLQRNKRLHDIPRK